LLPSTSRFIGEVSFQGAISPVAGLIIGGDSAVEVQALNLRCQIAPLKNGLISMVALLNG
jgi:hypothetical protein